MVNNPTDQSTLMRLLLTVLQFKLPSYQDKVQNKLTPFFWLMLPHYPSVSRLLVVWWLFWSPETQPSQQRNHKHSQPMLTTSRVCWFKSLRVRDRWPKITISWVNSTLMVSHLLLEEFHKSRSPSKSIRMVSWVFMPLIREHLRARKSPLPTIKVDFQKNKSKIWSRKPKNSRIKMRKSERELKLRMP